MMTATNKAPKIDRRARQVARAKGVLKVLASHNVVSLEAVQELGYGSTEYDQEVAVDAMISLGFVWDGDTFTKR